jgi:hypothetical protein
MVQAAYSQPGLQALDALEHAYMPGFATPQAQSLVWKDLSAEQLEALRAPQTGSSARTLLAKFMGLSVDASASPTHAILLDMYTYALKFGQVGC